MIGDKQDPCRTPARIFLMLEKEFFVFTLKDLFEIIIGRLVYFLLNASRCLREVVYVADSDAIHCQTLFPRLRFWQQFFLYS